MARRRTIEGHVVLEPPADLTAAPVVVSLNDTTFADAPATTVAESRFDVSGSRVARVPFCLEVPDDLPDDRRYTLGAEVRRHAGEVVAPGDYLNMQSVPWSAATVSAVEIPVRPIGRRGPQTGSGS